MAKNHKKGQGKSPKRKSPKRSPKRKSSKSKQTIPKSLPTSVDPINSSDSLKPGQIITDTQLANYIRAMPGKPRYFHLSVKPLKPEHLESVDQPLILGFNCGGRPSGFFFGVGDSWMRFLIDYRSGSNWNFCCYLYEIEVDESKFVKIDSLKRLKDFDKKVPDYWLGYENYDVCYKTLELNPARKVSFHRLFQKYRKGNKSLGEIYEQEKIIYTSIKALQAERKSLGLKPLSQDQIAYDRRKRWDIVAQKYDGVLLSPFYLNYNRAWYQSFTVAQGCIWNMRSLKRVIPLAHVVGRQGMNFSFMIDREF